MAKTNCKIIEIGFYTRQGFTMCPPDTIQTIKAECGAYYTSLYWFDKCPKCGKIITLL